MLNKTDPINIAIIGATGNVGRKIIEIFLQRNLISPHNINAFASSASAGRKIIIRENEFNVRSTEDYNFHDADLCLFATDSDISRNYIPKALANKALVIDSSSLFRLDPSVPLIVAPVNKSSVSLHKSRLYAIANCVASPISIALAPLHQAFSVKRVMISTYQSTSGAGKKAMDELYWETKNLIEDKLYERTHFPRQIAFNIIPQIDKILDDGFTYEEIKIMREIQKIVSADFAITATSVRVPVMIGHSVSLAVEFDRNFSLTEAKKLLANFPGIKLSEDHYTTPIEVVGSDDVHVGRIRRDPSVPFGLQLWLCSDNLRRGAATDAAEVAEELITQLRS